MQTWTAAFGGMTLAVTLWWVAGAIVAAGFVLIFGWRWASRRWELPYPAAVAWFLEERIADRLLGTAVSLQRMHLQPGQRVLEFGPGPGRILIPAAVQVHPGGEAVGVEIQSAMAKRLETRAAQAGVTNLRVIHGDATLTQVAAESFDVVLLVTVLGEIPDRDAALREAYRALKPGGMLSVTEVFGDPHYQSAGMVKRRAAAAGFEPADAAGHWWFYTANFTKPRAASPSCLSNQS